MTLFIVLKIFSILSTVLQYHYLNSFFLVVCRVNSKFLIYLCFKTCSDPFKTEKKINLFIENEYSLGANVHVFVNIEILC